MRFLLAVLSLLAIIAISSHAAEQECSASTPMIAPLVMENGKIVSARSEDVELQDVYSCCGSLGEGDQYKPVKIGQMPQMNSSQALKTLQDAKEAWNGGLGAWPQLSLKERIQTIETFLEELKASRDDIIQVLMYEIGKNVKDATSEFDRTVLFIQEMIAEVRKDPEFNSKWSSGKPVTSFTRRAAIGIILCLGPYNYPLNETWCLVFAALLGGNVVIMKIPTTGGLVHLQTFAAFAKSFPPGVIHFISGSGRITMPPLMASGDIDGLGFIGGSNAADKLIQAHPTPHRLKLFLQLEAKNMGIFLSDIFENNNRPLLLDNALKEAVSGALSFNGQRCTALKLFFIPQEHAEMWVKRFVEKVDQLNVGLPYETFDTGSSYASVTPLPNQNRLQYMRTLIEDAVAKGAKIVNKNGGTLVGDDEDSLLMIPAVLYPVTPDMQIYHEEQFGPVVPIVTYESNDLEPILEYGRIGKYGQQVSIFTAGSSGDASMLVDKFSAIFGKININAASGRSPDILPFSGRRSSAMGTMSVRYAVREFSVPTVVVYKGDGQAQEIAQAIEKSSVFMSKL